MRRRPASCRCPSRSASSAVYLSLDGTVLELLHFDRPGNDPERRRSFTEPGLTHLSFTVDDLAATCELVRQHGGEVLDDTEMGGLADLGPRPRRPAPRAAPGPHPPPQRSGSRGRPRRRSPITLRWISLVPPAMVRQRLARKPNVHWRTVALDGGALGAEQGEPELLGALVVLDAEQLADAGLRARARRR